MNNTHGKSRAAGSMAALTGLGLALLAAVSSVAVAQTADLASTPLITSAPNAVKPNIMFILDDSGSMARDYMPDEANFASSKYGRYAAQCNGLAYNPSMVYSVPVDSTGAELPAGTYTFANPADPATYPHYYLYLGTQPTLAYTYNTTGLITGTTFYSECNATDGTLPTKFTKVTVTPATITQNYRNWYTYYRTRMLTMRTAATLAFKGIGDKYRVGFSTISSQVVDGTKFLDVADYDPAQKAVWYSRLNGSDPDSFTPLRGALSKAGKYFAKKAVRGGGSAQSYDPVQFSCQKNFAILTTDGYWNDDTETGSYGPYRLDGTAVGQQDASAPRPMRDGGFETYTVSTPMQQVIHWSRTRTQTQRTTEQYVEYTSQSCGSGRRILYRRTVSRTRDAINTETSFSVNTQNYNSVVTYTGGTPSAPVKQNIVNGSYTSEGTTVNSGFTGGNWSNWTSPGWSAVDGVCRGGLVVPPNTAVTASTGPASAWSGYSAYNQTSAEAAVSTGAATESARSTTGGSSDSLADVAMYYYQTDLRHPSLNNCTLSNGTNVCTNNVTARGTDNAVHQHMTTFTLGLGVNGTLDYDPNYLGGASADYQAIVNGTLNWPNPNGGAANIDDLWHAAVNGRGQYFSAGDPTSLARSLADTLAAIDARTGTASAAATSSLQPTPGDSTEYVTSYTTVDWTGDVVAYQVDPTTGARSATPDWSAQQVLDARVAAGTPRNIFYMKRNAAANTGTARAFTYANLQADGFAGLFDNACSKAPALSQCATATAGDRTIINTGANMVAYLSGQANGVYRARKHVLSDMVGGAPVYVRKSPFLYTENGYQAWASALTRPGVIYVPSNGGMLHAFDGATGQEKWAFVPSAVMDRMYRLADVGYATKHEYYVNASPVVNDIYVPGLGWKTILVGGLGAGGRSYYAIDITNPDAPQVLWEFSNDSLGGNGNLGFTFGNPVVTKRANGQWVVVFASGYNNVVPGDGNGRLYVVNAYTGERITEVQTMLGAGLPAGTSTTPSGLSGITGWVDSPLNNTALRFYGGDLLGNLWRFDIDGTVAPTNAALRLAQLRGGSPAAAQPVTTRPEIAMVRQGSASYPVVFVGTGRLLGLSDLSNTNTQTIYAIKDPLTDTQLGDVHARADMVTQTMTEDPTTRARSISTNAVDWSTKSGWLVDLPSAGERVNIDMRIAFDTLVAVANAPANDACTAGGTSYLYQISMTNGSAIPDLPPGVWLGNSFAVGVGIMRTYDVTQQRTGDETRVRIQMGDGSVINTSGRSNVGSGLDGRRASWRELVD